MQVSKVKLIQFDRILLMCVLVFCVVLGEAIAAQGRSTIVLFGDSITVGINHQTRGVISGTPQGNTVDSPGTQGLPTILTQQLMDETRRNVVVANWGYGGSSSEFGEQRISNSLSTTKAQFPSANYYVLIIYGTNDFGQDISTSATKFNIEQMIVRANNLGFVPIVGTLTPRSDEDVQPANNKIRQIAGAQIVDHYNRFFNLGAPPSYENLLDYEDLYVGSENQKKGYLHPNDEGYQVIADLWFTEALEGLIEASPPPITSILELLLYDD